MNQKEKVYLIVNPGSYLFSEHTKQNCPYQRFRLVPQLLWRQIPYIGILSTKIQLLTECQQFQCSLLVFWAHSWTYASCLCVAAEKNSDVHLHKVQQRDKNHGDKTFMMQESSQSVLGYVSVKGFTALWACVLPLLWSEELFWMQSATYVNWKAVILPVRFQGSLTCLSGIMLSSYLWAELS